MSTNGAPGRPITFPDVVPPKSVSGSPRSELEVKEDEADYGWGFVGDLICWWRTRRERQLIERIRSLESEVALLREENLQQAGMLVRISQWNNASTAQATRIQEQMGFGVDRPPDRRSQR